MRGLDRVVRGHGLVRVVLNVDIQSVDATEKARRLLPDDRQLERRRRGEGVDRREYDQSANPSGRPGPGTRAYDPGDRSGHAFCAPASAAVNARRRRATRRNTAADGCSPTRHPATAGRRSGGDRSDQRDGDERDQVVGLGASGEEIGDRCQQERRGTQQRVRADEDDEQQQRDQHEQDRVCEQRAAAEVGEQRQRDQALPGRDHVLDERDEDAGDPGRR